MLYIEKSSDKINVMVRVKFYYKEGCYLCGMAEEMLNGLREKYDILIEKIDVETDDELYELYGPDIPVIEFRDDSILYGHIRKKDLLKKLEENKE